MERIQIFLPTSHNDDHSSMQHLDGNSDGVIHTRKTHGKVDRTLYSDNDNSKNAIDHASAHRWNCNGYRKNHICVAHNVTFQFGTFA